jgi:hypothetical protein
VSDIVEILQGYSGSQVLLITDGDRRFVRKSGNIARNLERHHGLANTGIAMPELLAQGPDHYDMSYIRHTDMVSWLLHNPCDSLLHWISDVIGMLDADSVSKDYYDVYVQKLGNPALETQWAALGFAPEQLLARLPCQLKSSNYHGDFTMDNILYGSDGRFYLIDPITTEYDSWIFDIAKLMQDLECGWFMRNRTERLQGKLWMLRKEISDLYPQAADPHLIILMLLRVLPYARNAQDTDWIRKEIARLWTS